jgi:DNA repair protein RAD50
MTSIEKVQICGVRSFDPNPANQQFIQFHKPLTVILGKNGAGKTTIIEALLNACTGAMPPGSGTEKGSFVYDPKVVGETEVKAQIRLIFTGKGGKLMQVIRSFQATRTNQRVTFTTLDNTVAFQDATTGEVISSTYRASDVDRVVPEMLGVSAAVLAHVIFCHQEDCNWPLGPPKDVKRIFDDIFAATRYVLALDRLRDNSKEFRRQLKEHEASLMALREHREQAKQLELQINQKEDVVRAIQGRSTSIEPELQDLRQALEQLRAAESQIESMQREVAVTRARLEERREALHRVDLPPDTCTLEALQEVRSNFGAQMRQVEEELAQNTKRHDSATQARRVQEEELYRTRSNTQLLEREDQLHRQNVARLRELLQGASSEFLVSESDVDERSVQRVLKRAEADVAETRQLLQSATADLLQSLRAAEDEVQSGLRLLDGNTNEAQMRQQSLEAVRRRVKDNASAVADLGGGEACRTQLRHLQDEVAELQQRVAAAEELRKKGSEEQRSQAILKELEEQNNTVAQLREQMMQQKQQERNQKEVEHLRQQVEESNASVASTLQGEVLPLLRAVGVQAPAVAAQDFSPLVLQSLRSQATLVHQAKVGDLQTLQNRVVELEKARATQEQKAAYLSEALVQCRREIASGREQCASLVSDLDAYEAQTAQAKGAAESTAQKWHALEALATCYHEFMNIARSESKCAVCERPFADHDAQQRFMDVNADKQRTSPEALAAAREAASAAQDAYQRLERLQSVVQSVRQHQSRAPVLEADLKALTVQMERSAAERAEACAARDAAQQAVHQLEGVCRQLAGLCMMDEKVAALKAALSRREKEMKAAQQQEGMIGEEKSLSTEDQTSLTRTFDELSEAYAAATDRLHQLNKLFTEAQRMERGQGEHAAERQLQQRKADMYQAEVAVAKLDDLERTAAELQQEVIQHRGRLDELAAQAAQLRATVDTHKARVQHLRAEYEKAEATQRGAVDQAETRLRELQLAVPPVLSYLQSGGAQRLDESRAHLREVENTCKATALELDGLAKRIEEARRTLSDQHRRSTDMDRQIDALQQQRSIMVDEGRLAEMEAALTALKTERLQGVDLLLGEEAKKQMSLSDLREMITAKMTSLEKLRAQQDGNMEAMLLDVAQLKLQLRSDKYQNIEKRYRSTFLKVQTTEISIQDIEKYYSALEKAVQSYHQEKIAQINQIIAELWRQTYRGSDIDTVEIRSETESTTTTAARRSYSYRVVMKRGNNEMDMRGRCSAGQKVLASIIIRMALSEAFCCDCGILALDEPTTNLDDDNARSLADALRTLIQARRAVKHFQLIVITHDEQFVRALGGQSLDKFFYIHKDREGAFSVIEERTFDQLFA